MLVVQAAPNTLAHIGLVAECLGVFPDFLRAELDAAVAAVRFQLHIDRKVKVLHFDFGPDELVTRNWLRGLPDNRTFLHGPVSIRSCPTGEGFSIEELASILGLIRVSELHGPEK